MSTQPPPQLHPEAMISGRIPLVATDIADFLPSESAIITNSREAVLPQFAADRVPLDAGNFTGSAEGQLLSSAPEEENRLLAVAATVPRLPELGEFGVQETIAADWVLQSLSPAHAAHAGENAEPRGAPAPKDQPSDYGHDSCQQTVTGLAILPSDEPAAQAPEVVRMPVAVFSWNRVGSSGERRTAAVDIEAASDSRSADRSESSPPHRQNFWMRACERWAAGLRRSASSSGIAPRIGPRVDRAVAIAARATFRELASIAAPAPLPTAALVLFRFAELVGGSEIIDAPLVHSAEALLPESRTLADVPAALLGLRLSSEIQLTERRITRAPEPQPLFAGGWGAADSLAPDAHEATPQEIAVAQFGAPAALFTAALPYAPEAATRPARGDELPVDPVTLVLPEQRIADSAHSLIPFVSSPALVESAAALLAPAPPGILLARLPAAAPAFMNEPNLLHEAVTAHVGSPTPAWLVIARRLAPPIDELSEIAPPAALKLPLPAPTVLVRALQSFPPRSRLAEMPGPIGASRDVIRRAGDRHAGRGIAIAAAMVLISILSATDAQLLTAMPSNHPAQLALNEIAQNGDRRLEKGGERAFAARLAETPEPSSTVQAENVAGAPGGTPPAAEDTAAVALGIAASPVVQIRVAAPSGGTLAERYKRAEAALTDARSKAAAASAERDRLSDEEFGLQQNLITNAAKLQQLEQTATEGAAELDRLNSQIASAKTGLARDRSQLMQAIAVLQRIRAEQRDGVLTTADDAMRAMRARQQVGAVLTPLSGDATRLESQLKILTNLKSAAADKRAETARNQATLNDTRDDLDRLIAERHSEQENLAAKVDEVQKVMDAIGREAGSLKALMDRIAGLRAEPKGNAPRVKAVGPGSSTATALIRGGLRPPVAGRSVPGDPAGPGVTPGASGPNGLWYQGTGGGDSVAPADSEVVYAGPYQKLGQVLILELAGGYHLALAGLGRIDVHVGDLVLAGEPVGSLPEGKSAPLYMELRRNGKVVDLAPWVSADIGKAKGT